MGFNASELSAGGTAKVPGVCPHAVIRVGSPGSVWLKRELARGTNNAV
jgi:hypothetical protein